MMAKPLLHNLSRYVPHHIIIESYEGPIYQAFLSEDGTEQLIWETPQTALKSRSLTEMHEKLSSLTMESLTLRQHSAYDEMIGQPLKAEENTLLIPLSTAEPMSKPLR